MHTKMISYEVPKLISNAAIGIGGKIVMAVGTSNGIQPETNHLISKLTGKYKMKTASASNVATNLIPNVMDGLIQKTQDPNNSDFTLDKLIGSLTGGGDVAPQQGNGGFNFQDLISKFNGGGNISSGGSGGGFDLQDIISKVTDKARNNIGNQNQSGGGGGLFDLIKGFIK